MWFVSENIYKLYRNHFAHSFLQRARTSPAIPCTIPECQSSTTAQLSSEAALQLLILLRQDAHQVADPPPAQAQPQSPSSIARVEKQTRPAVNAGMSESDWSFFLHKWVRYSRQTGIKDEVLWDELWYCMETDLPSWPLVKAFLPLQRMTYYSRFRTWQLQSFIPLYMSLHFTTWHSRREKQSSQSQPEWREL